MAGYAETSDAIPTLPSELGFSNNRGEAPQGNIFSCPDQFQWNSKFQAIMVTISVSQKF